jgi:hypothetical protein
MEANGLLRDFLDAPVPRCGSRQYRQEDIVMGRGILLWLLGVPIPIILLLAFCSR